MIKIIFLVFGENVIDSSRQVDYNLTVKLGLGFIWRVYKQNSMGSGNCLLQRGLIECNGADDRLWVLVSRAAVVWVADLLLIIDTHF